MPDDLMSWADEQRISELQRAYLFAPHGLKTARLKALREARTAQLRAELGPEPYAPVRGVHAGERG